MAVVLTPYQRMFAEVQKQEDEQCERKEQQHELSQILSDCFIINDVMDTDITSSFDGANIPV